MVSCDGNLNKVCRLPTRILSSAMHRTSMPNSSKSKVLGAVRSRRWLVSTTLNHAILRTQTSTTLSTPSLTLRTHKLLQQTHLLTTLCPSTHPRHTIRCIRWVVTIRRWLLSRQITRLQVSLEHRKVSVVMRAYRSIRSSRLESLGFRSQWRISRVKCFMDNIRHSLCRISIHMIMQTWVVTPYKISS